MGSDFEIYLIFDMCFNRILLYSVFRDLGVRVIKSVERVHGRNIDDKRSISLTRSGDSESVCKRPGMSIRIRDHDAPLSGGFSGEGNYKQRQT